VLTGRFLAVLAASLVSCAITSVGIHVIARHERWAQANTPYFISFAAGMLISVTLLHLLPKAYSMTQAPYGFFLVGFLGFYAINRLIHTFIHHNHDGANRTLGWVPMLALGFHSFVDGIIYAVTFNVSIFTGALAAAGLILHEFPEGIVTFVLLEQSGTGSKKASRLAFLATALTTPLGTIISYPLIQNIDRPLLGKLLGIAGGALLYVGATHLLPQVEKKRKRYSFLTLALGVAVAVIIVLTG
jgi:zinc transporter ZupT